MDEVLKNIIIQIDKIEKRLSALEAEASQTTTVNLPTKDEVIKSASQKTNFSGPKGGILLLIKENFLKTKKTTDDVKTALENKEYIYLRQVIQTALDRLSKPTGPLVKIEEDRKRLYVQRK